MQAKFGDNSKIKYRVLSFPFREDNGYALFGDVLQPISDGCFGKVIPYTRLVIIPSHHLTPDDTHLIVAQIVAENADGDVTVLAKAQGDCLAWYAGGMEWEYPDLSDDLEYIPADQMPELCEEVSE